MPVNERRQLAQTRPLLGVPFTIKDSFDVAEFPVTSGSVLRKNNVPKKDAVVVERVRSAGGILLATTIVPELCMWVESWNNIHGVAKNPHDTRRTPGGSSGGEGALIASAGSVVGIGTDLGGSVRIPSLMNGIFGLKPTPHVVPVAGFYPPNAEQTHSFQMNVCGPLCRYIEDIPLMFKVMGGREAAMILNPERPIELHKLRVFYMEELRSPWIEPITEDMRYAVKRAVRHLERSFDLVPVRVDLEDAHEAVNIEFVSFYEPNSSADFGDLVANFEYKISPWSELLKALKGKSNHTFPVILLAIIMKFFVPSSEEKLNAILYSRERLKRQIDELLGEDGVLIFPGYPSNADFHYQPVTKFFNVCNTGLINALTLPSLMCPMGKDKNGLPLGIQIIGPHRSEARLIAVAKELDRKFDGWHLPEHKYS